MFWLLDGGHFLGLRLQSRILHFCVRQLMQTKFDLYFSSIHSLSFSRHPIILIQLQNNKQNENSKYREKRQIHELPYAKRVEYHARGTTVLDSGHRQSFRPRGDSFNPVQSVMSRQLLSISLHETGSQSVGRVSLQLRSCNCAQSTTNMFKTFSKERNVNLFYCIVVHSVIVRNGANFAEKLATVCSDYEK